MLTALILSEASTILMSLSWGTIFFVKRNKSKAFLVMSLFFACIALTLLKTLSDSIQWLPLSRIIYLLYPFAILFIPALYLFYIYIFTFNSKKLPSWLYLFFIVPVALCLLSGYVFYLYYPSHIPASDFYQIMSGSDSDTFHLAQRVHAFTGTLFIIGLCLGIILPFWLLYKAMGKGLPSLHNKIKRLHLFPLLMLSSSMALATIIYHYTRRGHTTIEIFWFLGFLYMGYDVYIKSDKVKTVKKQTYKPKSIRKVRADLEKYFEKEKPWRDPLLTKPLLASRIGTNSRYLSEALRKELHTNYPTYVNKRRLAEAVRQINDPKNNLLLKEIANDVGFNDYNTFRDAFKKEMGEKPCEYCERVNKRIMNDE